MRISGVEIRWWCSWFIAPDCNGIAYQAVAGSTPAQRIPFFVLEATFNVGQYLCVKTSTLAAEAGFPSE